MIKILIKNSILDYDKITDTSEHIYIGQYTEENIQLYVPKDTIFVMPGISYMCSLYVKQLLGVDELHTINEPMLLLKSESNIEYISVNSIELDSIEIPAVTLPPSAWIEAKTGKIFTTNPPEESKNCKILHVIDNIPLIGAETDVTMCPICGNLSPKSVKCNCTTEASRLWDLPDHGLNPHNYSPSFIKRGSDTSVTLGVELEMYGTQTAHPDMSPVFKRNPFLYLMRDGTLPQYGCEVASHPFTYKYYLDNKSNDILMLDYFRKIGMKSSSKKGCGMHVHICKTSFESDEHLTAWIALITCNIKYLERIAGRTCGEYNKCVPYPNYEKVSKSCTDSDSYNRRSLMALRENTIEFRMFAGTLDNVYFNLEFVAATIAYAKHSLSIKKVGWTLFKQYLKNNLADYTKLKEFFIDNLVPKGKYSLIEE